MSDALDDLLRDVDGFGRNGASDEPAASADQPIPHARPDPERERRKGVPEVVYCPGKTVDQALEIAAALLERTGRALLSRVGPELETALHQRFASCRVHVYPASRMAVVRHPDAPPPDGRGAIGVITAGTSDVPIAEEAAVVAAEMGCEVVTAYDCGVAGLHRLAEPLRAMRQRRVDAIVVVAGMDGALPSVVSGLADVPVIGLPTSIGYGAGGKGVAALLSMLQTCSPGLAVVNIDNGVGAGAMAALIARRAFGGQRSATGNQPSVAGDQQD
jgi:NCAIR mutase (PurE)-related protein